MDNEYLHPLEKDLKWHRRFLELAELVSTWSKDPSTKVGAVIVDKNRRVISTGYNGFAIGVDDNEDRLNNREIKYKLVLHAEENAIMFAKRDLEGCSLYVTKMPPCSHGASLIIQSGIKNVYIPNVPIPDRWKERCILTNALFKEAGIGLHRIVLTDLQK